MWRSLRRLFGLHNHEWGLLGAPYCEDHSRVDIDPYGGADLIEWTAVYQDRTCKSCGLLQQVRIR